MGSKFYLFKSSKSKANFIYSKQANQKQILFIQIKQIKSKFYLFKSSKSKANFIYSNQANQKQILFIQIRHQISAKYIFYIIRYAISKYFLSFLFKSSKS